jgi:hypothetical protein
VLLHLRHSVGGGAVSGGHADLEGVVDRGQLSLDCASMTTPLISTIFPTLWPLAADM